MNSCDSETQQADPASVSQDPEGKPINVYFLPVYDFPPQNKYHHKAIVIALVARKIDRPIMEQWLLDSFGIYIGYKNKCVSEELADNSGGSWLQSGRNGSIQLPERKLITHEDNEILMTVYYILDDADSDKFNEVIFDIACFAEKAPAQYNNVRYHSIACDDSVSTVGLRAYLAEELFQADCGHATVAPSSHEIFDHANDVITRAQ